MKKALIFFITALFAPQAMAQDTDGEGLPTFSNLATGAGLASVGAGLGYLLKKDPRLAATTAAGLGGLYHYWWRHLVPRPRL